MYIYIYIYIIHIIVYNIHVYIRIHMHMHIMYMNESVLGSNIALRPVITYAFEPGHSQKGRRIAVWEIQKPFPPIRSCGGGGGPTWCFMAWVWCKRRPAADAATASALRMQQQLMVPQPQTGSSEDFCAAPPESDLSEAIPWDPLSSL